MEQVGSILPRTLKNQLLSRKPPVAEVLAAMWPRMVGKLIARHSQPVAFCEGRLTIKTSSPAWAAELLHVAEELRRRANELLGGAVIRKVLVHCQPDKSAAVELTPPAGPQPMPRLRLEEAKAILWPQAKANLDPELAEVVERSFVKYFSRNGRRTEQWD